MTKHLSIIDAIKEWNTRVSNQNRNSRFTKQIAVMLPLMILIFVDVPKGPSTMNSGTVLWMGLLASEASGPVTVTVIVMVSLIDIFVGLTIDDTSTSAPNTG